MSFQIHPHDDLPNQIYPRVSIQCRNTVFCSEQNKYQEYVHVQCEYTEMLTSKRSNSGGSWLLCQHVVADNDKIHTPSFSELA